MEALERLQEFRKRREDLEKQIREESKGLFKQVSDKIFEKHPLLNSFGWSQYTPYFNDGNECVFSANTDYIYINVGDQEDNDFARYAIYDVEWKGRDKTETLKPNLSPKELAGKEILELLSNFADDDYKNMFGDHVKVTVSREGVEVEDYDHD